jgi:S-adenosylmethionine synthetase
MDKWRLIFTKSQDSASLASSCLVEISYAIGVLKPASIMIETYGRS